MAKKHFGKLLTLAAIVGAQQLVFLTSYSINHSTRNWTRISTTLKMISMILTMPAIKKLPRLLIQLPPNAAMFP